MGEFVKIAVEILSAVLPDSDIGKVAVLTLVLVFLLFLFGRLKPEWIGRVVRHIFRWLRCKVRNKHRYFLDGIGHMDIQTGRISGTYVCEICGRVSVQQ